VHQVHQYLLDLHAVDRDLGQDRREVQLQPAVVHARVAGEQRVHFADQLVDVLRLAPHVLVAHQRADAPDDLAGAQRLPEICSSAPEISGMSARACAAGARTPGRSWRSPPAAG
jgi:hypothetical protein